ncbi:MAG: hypothetical protein HQK51_11130 [Oligoflexia bacterium]|nr:hypothetical protein [Oligoflexia bacterium]
MHNKIGEVVVKLSFDMALRRIETQLAMVTMSRKMNQLKEIEVIQSMITTYNHEINNPLSIAIGFSEDLSLQYSNEEKFKKMKEVLWRIAGIVRKIDQVLNHETVEYERYTNALKMLKLT